MPRNCRTPSRTDAVDQRVGDPCDVEVIDERWVTITFGDTHLGSNGSDRALKEEAEAWATREFGSGFFRFGNRFFFKGEPLLVQFKLRWA